MRKVLLAVNYVLLDEHPSVDAAYDAGIRELEEFVGRLERERAPLPAGAVDLDLTGATAAALSSNFTPEDFQGAVERAREYILAGDAFQVVLSQRFSRRTTADPFEIYRALRIVNPSPYMIYLQTPGVDPGGVEPGDPLPLSGPGRHEPSAGRAREAARRDGRGGPRARGRAARRREGARGARDARRPRPQRRRPRVRAGVDRTLPRVLEVERYSHVMHLSSTVTGRLREELDCWDALRETLPVGTVSGAPKIRAMQIIDELEPTRRGPYAGGIGYVGLGGEMDVAIALRTMVVPTGQWQGGAWTVHLQAGAGIVADSVPEREYEETVNKAAALNRAIDLAEVAFRSPVEVAES